MNNFYALIYLTDFLKDNFQNYKFSFSYSPFKDIWEGYIHSETVTKRLVFSANPTETALFLDKDRPAKKSNVTTFFEILSDDFIQDFSLAEGDRIMTIHFKSERKLMFLLFGNHPNIFLIEDGLIRESFKNNQDNKGKTPPQPRPVTNPKIPKDGISPKKAIIKTDPAFPRHLIQPIIEHFDLENKSTSEIYELTRQLTEQMKSIPEFRVLEDGNLCLIPSSTLPVKNMKVFPNVNEAIRFVYYQTSRERRLSNKVQSIKPGIDQALKRTQSTIKQLKQADKGVERAQTYEQYGHILMAHAHEKSEGQSSITLSNFYDDNKPVEIPIKPELSIADNAQYYYEKSSKALRNVKESKRRLKEMEEVKKELESLLNSFANIEKIYEFDEWMKDHENELKELGILSGKQQAESLPYRKLSIDNYEVWVGKNAKSNDRLTSDAHKEDIWLHARGVAGSHVAIRMNNQKDYPPKSVILRAAAVAAWNSKARGSKLVPVIVTKRKYVIKPKGAPAGAVRLQREQVEMVEPQKNPA